MASPSTNIPDPDDYRMSLGDHLQELRRRLLLAIVGLVVAVAACAAFGTSVIDIFCRPLTSVLLSRNISPQLYFTGVGDPIAVYMYIVCISAAVIASPWIVYQLWLFAAAGLYPSERKMVWRFAPLSVGLLIGGVVFSYFVVLPASIGFFIDFGSDFPLHLPSHVTTTPTTMPMMRVTPLAGDPTAPQAYQMWFDTLQQRLKFALPADGGKVDVMVIPFGPRSLIAPMITLPEYIDMVLLWLLVFGIAFQLPLVQMAAVKMGIIELKTLRASRRIAYLAIIIIAALIMPDVFAGTLALAVPLVMLYELGIFLAWSVTRHREIT